MDNKGKIVSQKKLPSDGEIAEFLNGFNDAMEMATVLSPSNWRKMPKQLLLTNLEITSYHI